MTISSRDRVSLQPNANANWIDRRFRWHRDSHPAIALAITDVSYKLGLDPAAGMTPQDLGRVLELICADYVAGIDGQKLDVIRFPGNWV